MTCLLLILLLVFGCSPTDSGNDGNGGDNGSGENDGFSGITETNANGDFTGNIDEDDWCETISTSGYDSCENECYTDYGLSPVHPNPVDLGEYGTLGTLYQVCYEYTCPNIEEFIDSNGNPGYKEISIVIINEENDILYTHNDEYCWGKVGTCAYLPESLESDIYRMKFNTQNNFECHGDIQLN